MHKKLFYFENLNKYDRLTFIIYVFISIIVFVFYNYVNSTDTNNKMLFYYIFSTIFFLYLFSFKSLRNLSSYLIWLGISLIQFLFYLGIKNNPNLEMGNSNAALGLRNVFILLIVFQVLRFVNIKIQKQEFVAPSRGSNVDVFDNRKINYIDYISFLVYLATYLILTIKI